MATLVWEQLNNASSNCNAFEWEFFFVHTAIEIRCSLAKPMMLPVT